MDHWENFTANGKGGILPSSSLSLPSVVTSSFLFPPLPSPFFITITDSSGGGGGGGRRRGLNSPQRPLHHHHLLRQRRCHKGWCLPSSSFSEQSTMKTRRQKGDWTRPLVHPHGQLSLRFCQSPRLLFFSRTTVSVFYPWLEIERGAIRKVRWGFGIGFSHLKLP